MSFPESASTALSHIENTAIYKFLMGTYQRSYFNFLTMFLFFEGGGNILVYPVYLKVQTKGMELEPIKGKPDKVSMRFQDSFAVFSVGVYP